VDKRDHRISVDSKDRPLRHGPLLGFTGWLEPPERAAAPATLPHHIKFQRGAWRCCLAVLLRIGGPVHLWRFPAKTSIMGASCARPPDQKRGAPIPAVTMIAPRQIFRGIGPRSPLRFQHGRGGIDRRSSKPPVFTRWRLSCRPGVGLRTSIDTTVRHGRGARQFVRLARVAGGARPVTHQPDGVIAALSVA